MQPETKMLFDQLAADVDQAFQAARNWERQAKDWEEQWKQATARAERAEKLVVTHFIALQDAERHAAELAQALAVAEGDDKIGG